MGSAVTHTEPQPINEVPPPSTGHSIWDDVLIDPFDYEYSDEEVPTRNVTTDKDAENKCHDKSFNFLEGKRNGAAQTCQPGKEVLVSTSKFLDQ